MRNGEWILSYLAYDPFPGAHLLFGREASGIFCLTEPDIAFADIEEADAALPGEDGVRMGRDYQRTATVTFELGVDGSNKAVYRHVRQPWAKGPRIGEWSEVEEFKAIADSRYLSPQQRGQDGVDMLRQVWRADGIRERAGRVSWLIHRTEGRSRRLYGRPRKFAVSHSRLTRQGYIPVVAEFKAIDDRFYDEVEKTAEMYDQQDIRQFPRPGRPEGHGRESQKTAVISQQGTVNTFPHIEIHGPCANPKVSIAGLWSVQLNMTIARGDHVVIDPRPWIRTVTHYDGDVSKGSVADKLTKASPRLSRMFLPPGSWTASMSYTRTAVTGSGPLVNILWRDAHTWW